MSDRHFVQLLSQCPYKESTLVRTKEHWVATGSHASSNNTSSALGLGGSSSLGPRQEAGVSSSRNTSHFPQRAVATRTTARRVSTPSALSLRRHVFLLSGYAEGAGGHVELRHRLHWCAHNRDLIYPPSSLPSSPKSKYSIERRCPYREHFSSVGRVFFFRPPPHPLSFFVINGPLRSACKGERGVSTPPDQPSGRDDGSEARDFLSHFGGRVSPSLSFLAEEALAGAKEFVR